MRKTFVERSIEELLRAADQNVFAEATARSSGLLQSLDARVKLAGFLALLVAATSSRSLGVIVTILSLALVLMVVSNVRALGLFGRVWTIAFLFTSAIALPALVLTPGESIATVPLLGADITQQGLKAAAYLLARVETAATLSLLLVVTTRWASLLAALRSFGVPVVFVVILGMAYRYIFVLLRTAFELFDGRRSRRLGALTAAEQRHLATATGGALLSKSVQLSDEIYLAMQARGFRGDIRVMDPRPLRVADWTALACFLAVALAAGVAGR